MEPMLPHVLCEGNNECFRLADELREERRRVEQAVEILKSAPSVGVIGGRAHWLIDDVVRILTKQEGG